jgi:hypothetical protein
MLYFRKTHALAVSYLTVPPPMMSNNHRSFSYIGGTCMIHSSIGMLHSDEEIKHDETCWIAAIFF